TAVPRLVVVVAAADGGTDRRIAMPTNALAHQAFREDGSGLRGHWEGTSVPIAGGKIVDGSLELDPKNFGMRTPAGFTKDLQFAMEVLKEHDAPGGAGQIVRGVHMRLHAGSHVDAPEHNVRGGTQIHELPLELFIGDAVSGATRAMSLRISASKA